MATVPERWEWIHMGTAGSWRWAISGSLESWLMNGILEHLIEAVVIDRGTVTRSRRSLSTSWRGGYPEMRTTSLDFR